MKKLASTFIFGMIFFVLTVPSHADLQLHVVNDVRSPKLAAYLGGDDMIEQPNAGMPGGGRPLLSIGKTEAGEAGFDAKLG